MLPNPSLKRGPATAGRLGPAGGARYIFATRAKPSCRSGPLSSNVRRLRTPSVRLVAFFRNLNLGQRLAPSRSELELAFLEAGATSAASFQTNGTVVFNARSLKAGMKAVRLACEQFERTNGFTEPAFVRSWDYLVAMVERRPFESHKDATVHAHAVTFLHAEADLSIDLPTRTSRGDVRIVEYTASEILCASYKTGANTAGSPNVFAERLFGLPATTRVWSTIERLVRRDASEETPSK